MIKVLIVDDEPMAIEAIKLAADWDEFDAVICGECTNGKDALRLAQEMKPDLIITDVDMPVMNGIELVKRVSDIDSDIKFIIVSGYDQFEYAKSAMQLGVQHYILKPVFKDEFTEVLLQILPDIEQSKRVKTIYSERKEFDIGILFETFLAGKLSAKDIEDAFGYETIKEITDWAFAVLDTIHNNYMDDSDKVDYIGFKVFDEIQESLMAEGMKDAIIYPVFLNNGINGFILCSTGKTTIYRVAESLCSTLRKIYNNGFYLAIGNEVKDFTQLDNSMREAEKAMNYRFYAAPGSILQYKDYANSSFCYSIENIEYMEELQNAFENIDIDRILKALDFIFEVFKNKHISYEMIEMYVNSIIYKSLSILTAMGENTDNIPLLKNISMIFSTEKTLNEIEQKIKQYCIDFCNYVQDVKNRFKLADKIKVEEYINENYRRNITIKEISSKLFIHPTYLGSQINKWFGCSFNDYLHSLRMKEAERLIKSTDLKVHDIAEYLGYASYSNFLEQFTKTFLMKPSEYRNKFKNSN